MKSRVLFILLLLPVILFSQVHTIKGKITDAVNGEPLIGVNIMIMNKMTGTATNNQGLFTLNTSTRLPFTIIISYVGFKKQLIEITETTTSLDIQLKEQPMLGQEVVISASRVEESIMRSPVTIEKMNALEIQLISAPNFFDGLYNIKGVDVNTHSFLFKYPNTRGFMGEANKRMSQLVDGVENIPPGLSFSAGNLFGLSPVDVESVELLVGASSALYGPGGVNGILLMQSKNPYKYQGLTASFQTGLMHVDDKTGKSPTPMGDFNFRFAKAFKDRLAFKLVGRYLNATDWYASDYRDRNHLNDPSVNRSNDEGYDGVNVYGDDIFVPFNLKDYNSSFPDQLVTRNGWVEKDLVDYNTKIINIDGSVHYRITENVESMVRLNYGQGSTVYTAQNRFMLKDFYMTTFHAEVKSPYYYLRGYYTADNSGESYNAGQTAMIINEKFKRSEQWYQQYLINFMNEFFAGKPLEEAYRVARTFANNRKENGDIINNEQPAWPIAGSDEFNNMFNDIISKPLRDGGSKVIDKSSLYHFEGMYNLKEQIKFFELMLGGSYRYYSINSEGTVFADSSGHPITINQFGAFAQLIKTFLNDKLKVNLAARFDKNEYFNGRFTPRFSVVYSVDKDEDHNIRSSIQTAYRFPTVADQWVNLQVGPFKVVGGLPEVQELNGFNDAPLYPLSGRNVISDHPVTENGPYVMPEFRPERVLTYEVGYKGLFFTKTLYVDAYVFLNRFNGFHATQLLAQYPDTEEEKRFQTIVSTDDPIYSMGWALGLDYRTPRGFMLRSNVAFNIIENPDSESTGLETGFNTPRYRFNISAGKRDVFRIFGFNISYRWQDKFMWQSTFGAAEIPAFSILDAHITTYIPALRTTIKLGGSNIINSYYTSSFGSAQIGGLYYITIIINEMMY